MDKNKIILIAIVILVIVLAAVVLVINNTDVDLGIANNTTELENATNITIDEENATPPVVANLSENASFEVENTSVEDNGWKWSDEDQCYVHQFVDADGDLHVQTANIDGIKDIEFKADGTVYSNGKDVTERYYRDFQ